MIWNSSDVFAQAVAMGKVGGMCSILVGVLYVMVAVTHLRIPLDQRAAVGNIDAFYRPFAQTTSIYYSPPTIVVVIGIDNTATWVNNDDAPHTVTATDCDFNSGNLNAGQTWTYTFTTPGTYTYFCSYHPWMKGTVIAVAATG